MTHADFCDSSYNPGYSDYGSHSDHYDTCYDFSNYADAWSNCGAHSNDSPPLCPGAFQGNFYVDNDCYNDVNFSHTPHTDVSFYHIPHSDVNFYHVPHIDTDFYHVPHTDQPFSHTSFINISFYHIPHSDVASHDDCSNHWNWPDYPADYCSDFSAYPCFGHTCTVGGYEHRNGYYDHSNTSHANVSFYHVPHSNQAFSHTPFSHTAFSHTPFSHTAFSHTPHSNTDFSHTPHSDIAFYHQSHYDSCKHTDHNAA